VTPEMSARGSRAHCIPSREYRRSDGGLRVTQTLALHQAAGAGVVELWLEAFLLDRGGRSMTSGGADVKLIFWEIACPGKARFRERWTRHQAGWWPIWQGYEQTWADDEREAPHDIAHQSLQMPIQSPRQRGSAHPLLDRKEAGWTSVAGCDAAVDWSPLRSIASCKAEG
jgi:hypothetical protein